MKKSKLLALGLIALMLAGGLALASCGEEPKCPSGFSSDKPGDCGVGVAKQCDKRCIDLQWAEDRFDAPLNTKNYSCICDRLH